MLKQYKSRRNDITSTLESQQKFTKEVTRCVNGLLDAKLADDSRSIDEEIYDLLQRLAKAKDFIEKHRT